VEALQEIAGLQPDDLAPDRLRRDAETLGQRLDRGKAELLHEVEDLPLARRPGLGIGSGRAHRVSVPDVQGTEKLPGHARMIPARPEMQAGPDAA